MLLLFSTFQTVRQTLTHTRHTDRQTHTRQTDTYIHKTDRHIQDIQTDTFIHNTDRQTYKCLDLDSLEFSFYVSFH